MRLREFFRGNERKPTPSIIAGLDTGTFIHAASDKNTENLQKYLQAGYPPDQIDPISKSTALHAAVESHNIRSVQLLIHAGGHVNIIDGNQSTPLHLAAAMAFEEAVHILLLHGADMFISDNTGRNAFHLAVATGNNRLIQLFLSMTDEDLKIINTPDSQNWTPLMCACASNQSSTCSFLINLGAHINVCNDRGLNVFHIAAFLGSLSLVQELFHSSIDEEIVLKALNQGDHKNQTPLFYACVEGHTDIAMIFLFAGANPYHLDNEQQTCLHAMLSSSIIFKRHIRLFYRFIHYVDYRMNSDQLGRTLLDLAYLNQLSTICSLLNYLHYPRHYQIIAPSTSSIDDHTLTTVLTLRQQCVLLFKRSIDNHYRSKIVLQRDLLESAMDQCFQLNSKLNHCSQSMENLNSNEKKTNKSTKLSSLAMFTNRFKRERTQSSQDEADKNQSNHPMKHLAFQLFNNSNRLDDILDLPMFNNHPLLEDDLKTTMINYNLDRIDSSNPI